VEIPVTQARAELAELVNRVTYTGERVTLTRHGKPVAALVSAADLETLRALEEVPVGRSGVGYAVPDPGTPAKRPFDVAAEHRPGQP
jgi:prevent-host-death family protein